MTERTWILLIICVTVICLASIVADCYKAERQSREEKRRIGWRPTPPHKGSKKEEQHEQE